MIAASLAAPTGAQHCPPRALRGASGSSAPGNRLPQPTTQPAPCMPPGTAPVQPTAVALQPRNYRKKLPPARLSPGILPAGYTTVSKQPRNLLPRPTCRSYRRAYRRGTTAKNYRRVLPPRNYPRTTYPPGILPRDGSRAQRAGDSDVGANDKGAGDDPGDGVDAH